MTEEHMRLPDFLIVGSCKSGTTTLYDDLALHPMAGLPDEKEPDILHKAGGVAEVRAAWSRHFSGTAPEQIRGEASTMYSMTPEYSDVSGLARAALGETAKIIYLMRQPVSRIISHLAHDIACGRIDGSDLDTTALTNDRYVDWSDYPRQLTPWLEAFGAGNVLPLVFEDFVRDRHETAKRVAEFVGLSAADLPARTAVSNVRGSQRSPKAKWVKTLVRSDFYRQKVRGLVPAEMKGRLREALMRQQNVDKIVLQEATLAELERRLSHVAPGLRDLGIETGSW